MASQKQIAANRRNAAQSTGPRTPEGKRRVSANAVQHGFYGSTFTIPGESQAEFHAIYEEFLAEHRPVGPVETSLVQQLALAHFRILRFHALTAAAFDKTAGEDSVLNKDILHLDRMLNSAERSFSRSLRDLTKLQKGFVDPAPTLEDTIAVESTEPNPPKVPGFEFDPRRSSDQSQSLEFAHTSTVQPHLAILKEMGLNSNYRKEASNF